MGFRGFRVYRGIGFRGLGSAWIPWNQFGAWSLKGLRFTCSLSFLV